MENAKSDVLYLKEFAVKPYLQKLNINWKLNYNGKTFDDYLN
jgi:hypothetical protein